MIMWNCDCHESQTVDFLLLSVRVRQAHRDPKDAVGLEEVPSVHLFLM